MTPNPSDDIAELLQRFGLGDEDRDAWLASALPAASFDDWLIDRVARRPAGSRAIAVYGAADVHDFARRAILEDLGLGPDDVLLDIGCGGGLLLREALARSAEVVGLDHSPAMVELARSRASGARVVEGDAEHLPFDNGAFTAVSMSIVFFFLDDPVAALRECRRVLRPGGRIAVYTTSPELRGTPAAPEPVASAGHFYRDDDLARLAEGAGFREVRVRNEDGGQLLSGRS